MLMVVAAGSALLFCRPPPKDTNKPDTSDPDTEFADSTEFSTSSSSSGDSAAADQNLPYEACRDKKCGTPCTVCDPNDDSCTELQLIHQCALTGQCVVAPVDCTAPKPEKGKDAKKKK
ncbi:MAG: hypothetical protein JW940_06035 [Polyangiaceae bacterium]|nr:hypothetical protein [Polyangiaceae bacterium]